MKAIIKCALVIAAYWACRCYAVWWRGGDTVSFGGEIFVLLIPALVALYRLTVNRPSERESE